MQPYTAPQRFDHVRQPLRIILAQTNNGGQDSRNKTTLATSLPFIKRSDVLSKCTIPLHHWETVAMRAVVARAT